MILALAITTIFNTMWMVSGSFWGLFVTGTLLIPEHYLAFFPILRSIVIAFFLFFVQPKLERFGFRNPMLIGLVLFVVSTTLLILTPTEALWLLLISIFIDALAYGFVIPRSDSLTQLLIEPSERARIRAIMMVIVLGISFPFGYIAGWLSEMDRRLPFVLCGLLMILVFTVIASSKKRLLAIQKEHAPE
jgi:MFS family permease